MKTQAFDIFCGIGGLSFGLKQAGIEVVAGLDSDDSCSTAFERNIGAKFILADIAEYDFSDMVNCYLRDAVKVLVGCPPCQPFSSHTYKKRNRTNDGRWNLLGYFVDAIDIIEPEVISMENVRGIIKTDVFNDFIEQVQRRGFHIDYEVVYCPDYGIPQSRRRLVLVGSRLGRIRVPSKTHCEDQYETVSDVMRKLPGLMAGESSVDDTLHRCRRLNTLNLTRIRHSKPNGTWRDWNKDLLPPCFLKVSGKTYPSVYGRMSWDHVSPTITTQFYNYGSGRFGHPEQDRALSLREGALLQTFPEFFDFGDRVTMSTIGRQIGNAVPPRLGYVIGKEISNHIRKYHAD